MPSSTGTTAHGRIIQASGCTIEGPRGYVRALLGREARGARSEPTRPTPGHSLSQHQPTWRSSRECYRRQTLKRCPIADGNGVLKYTRACEGHIGSFGVTVTTGWPSVG